jgi:hypothetical protein
MRNTVFRINKLGLSKLSSKFEFEFEFRIVKYIEDINCSK